MQLGRAPNTPGQGPFEFPAWPPEFRTVFGELPGYGTRLPLRSRRRRLRRGSRIREPGSSPNTARNSGGQAGNSNGPCSGVSPSNTAPSTTRVPDPTHKMRDPRVYNNTSPAGAQGLQKPTICFIIEQNDRKNQRQTGPRTPRGLVLVYILGAGTGGRHPWGRPGPKGRKNRRFLSSS